MVTTSDFPPPNAYVLAHIAEAPATPDSLESPGAEWLTSVYHDALELIEDCAADCDVDFDGFRDVEDRIHERADQAVPIYTHHRWQVFVDLAAYQEDVDDFGPIEDLTDAAGVALYMIARRLIEQVVEEHREEDL
jgi:hypothetical protein